MIGKWGFSLLPFYLGIIPIFANNNYTLTILYNKTPPKHYPETLLSIFLKQKLTEYIIADIDPPFCQPDPLIRHFNKPLP